MNFYRFNPHPRGELLDDCVIRSIVCTTSMPYDLVRRQLNGFRKVTGASKFYSGENPHRFAEDVLSAKKLSVPKNMTAEEFCNMHSCGRYILDMDGHWSACCNGDLYDSFDCRNNTVNFAYEINTEGYSPPDLSKQIFRYCCTSMEISDTEAQIRIYDGNGQFVERKIPKALTAGYIRCLQDEHYEYVTQQTK